jgi:hypothetical protein
MKIIDIHLLTTLLCMTLELLLYRVRSQQNHDIYSYSKHGSTLSLSLYIFRAGKKNFFQGAQPGDKNFLYEY